MEKIFIVPIFLSCLFLVLFGCATQPKPPTIGEKIGRGIDNAVAWTVNGLNNLAKKSNSGYHG